MTVQEWLGEDNKLGIDIWEKKYRYENETFDDWLERVSGGHEDVKNLIKEKKFLFGGRILSNRGLQNLGKKVTFSNCYVIAPPEDNIESIFNCAKQLARTYSYGGGCGIDISNLAPKGAKVNNAANETTGSVSFMDLYSLVTELIAARGRRGALMISIDCHHPDLEDFINIKNDLNKVTKANISIRITKDFMEAVKNNTEFELSFTRRETNETIKKNVNAREIFHKIAESNWNMGEPGFLYWDRIEDWNILNKYQDYKYKGVNPCSEEPLPEYGACLLGSINLAEFVYDKHFDYESFKKAIIIAVSALDDVLEEGRCLHPLVEQQITATDWRQIGLGIFGLADMLIKMELLYGSKESLDLCSSIAFTLANTSIYASSILAKNKGVFSKYNKNNTFDSKFFKENTLDQTKEMVEKYGLRNSQLLTIAPTGSLSSMLGVSGGMEPIFANYYTRKTESLKNKEEYYKVYTPIVKEYMDKNNLQSDKDLPKWFVTSADIPIENRIKMQSVWQEHIDASISSTINLPNSATVEDVENIYLKAYEYGLKGITVFRDGCKRTGILTTGNSESKNNAPKISKEDGEFSNGFPRGMIEKVPDGLDYRKYKLKTGCGNLYLFVGVDEDRGRIYDIFTNTDGVGGCTVNTQANSRLISAGLRGGVPIEYLIEQLNKSGTCPSFQFQRGKGCKLSNGKSCPSAIACVLRDIQKELEESMKDDEDDSEMIDTNTKPEVKYINMVKPTNKDIVKIAKGEGCPECGEEIRHEGGCLVCPSCGWSKCN